MILVLRVGVYMQGIVGVFSTKALADAAETAAKAQERDDYHTFHQIPIEPDKSYQLEGAVGGYGGSWPLGEIREEEQRQRILERAKEKI